MIEETATVVARDGNHVWVESGVRSGCSSCGSSGSCGTSVLAGLFKPRSNRFRVYDPLQLRVGEQAVLGLQAGELVKAALLTYLMPLLLMVSAAMLASSEGFADLAVMAVSLISLYGGMLLLRLISRRKQGGLAQVTLLRRATEQGEHTVQFIQL